MEHSQQKEIQKKIQEGLERLAFGSVGDAVKLLFCEEISPRMLNRLDLFPVAEIKRPKGGGVEMKFFDRLRAMQCLQEFCQDHAQGSDEFYRAPQQTAGRLEENAP